MVETFDKTWSTGEGNDKPLWYSCLENPMNSMKRQDIKKKDELPKLVSAQYAIRDQWRNNSRKNEEIEPNQNQPSCGCDLVIKVKSSAVRTILRRNLER